MITWRQTTKYSLASGCGNYRIAKCKCGPDLWKYIAYAKIEEKWQIVSDAVGSADEAKEECYKWMQKN